MDKFLNYAMGLLLWELIAGITASLLLTQFLNDLPLRIEDEWDRGQPSKAFKKTTMKVAIAVLVFYSIWFFKAWWIFDSPAED